jgi:hypothetical protein
MGLALNPWRRKGNAFACEKCKGLKNVFIARNPARILRSLIFVAGVLTVAQYIEEAFLKWLVIYVGLALVANYAVSLVQVRCPNCEPRRIGSGGTQ